MELAESQALIANSLHAELAETQGKNDSVPSARPVHTALSIATIPVECPSVRDAGQTRPCRPLLLLNLSPPQQTQPMLPA